MTDPHVRFRALAAAYLAEVLPPDESTCGVIVAGRRFARLLIVS